MPRILRVDSSKKADSISVLGDEVTIGLDTGVVERIKIGHGAAGEFSDVTEDSPLPTSDPAVLERLGAGVVTTDASPGLEPVSAIGVTVEAGASTNIVALVPSRVRLDLQWTGDNGRLWLGFNEPAQVGRGLFLAPGQSFSEFTTAAVTALFVGTGSPVVVGQEWGT